MNCLATSSKFVTRLWLDMMRTCIDSWVPYWRRLAACRTAEPPAQGCPACASSRAVAPGCALTLIIKPTIAVDRGSVAAAPIRTGVVHDLHDPHEDVPSVQQELNAHAQVVGVTLLVVLDGHVRIEHHVADEHQNAQEVVGGVEGPHN